MQTNQSLSRLAGKASAIPTPTRAAYIKWFQEISIEDIPLVGGKNASLGEMVRQIGRAHV